MELSEIIPHIEVLVFASEKPLTSLEIVELINNAFGFMEKRITLDQVESCIEGIREKYDSEFYPFEVRESGGGWQFLTKKDYHKTIAQLNGDKFLKRLSNAALETLAIIAYKQPITKGEIEAIRGVNSDYSIQKLLEKELIIISGRNDQLPGKPLIYSTSKTFMDYFGINSADDLPKIKEILAEQMVEPTIVNGIPVDEEEEAALAEADEALAVDTNGDLVPHAEEEGENAKEPESIEDETLHAEQTYSNEEAVDNELIEEENETEDVIATDEEIEEAEALEEDSEVMEDADEDEEYIEGMEEPASEEDTEENDNENEHPGKDKE
ncbi:MAG: SMC-Scp complex subunit ScpB [Filimonas sp.]|nr:SMC-Scp complex subunit ScpB [Filimonas sp.]